MSDDIISKALGLPSITSYNKDVIEESIEDVEIVEELSNDEDGEDELDEVIEGEIVETEEVSDNLPEKFTGDVEYINDIDKAKNNVSRMIRDGHEAFETLILLATQTENPRAFEVASKMLTDLVNANKELVNFSEKKSNAKTLKSQNNNITNNNTTNNLNISTAELLKILKGDGKK